MEKEYQVEEDEEEEQYHVKKEEEEEEVVEEEVQKKEDPHLTGPLRWNSGTTNCHFHLNPLSADVAEMDARFSIAGLLINWLVTCRFCLILFIHSDFQQIIMQQWSYFCLPPPISECLGNLQTFFFEASCITIDSPILRGFRLLTGSYQVPFGKTKTAVSYLQTECHPPHTQSSTYGDIPNPPHNLLIPNPPHTQSQCFLPNTYILPGSP